MRTLLTLSLLGLILVATPAEAQLRPALGYGPPASVQPASVQPASVQPASEMPGSEMPGQLRLDASLTAPEGPRTNWTLVAPGAAMLGAGWAIGWLTTIVWNLASVDCHTGRTADGAWPTVSCDPPRGPFGEGDWQMAIPIVGPFLTFVGDDTFRGDDVWFPVTMAALQIAGVVLLAVGLATPRPPRAPRERTRLDVSADLGGASARVAIEL